MLPELDYAPHELHTKTAQNPAPVTAQAHVSQRLPGKTALPHSVHTFGAGINHPPTAGNTTYDAGNAKSTLCGLTQGVAHRGNCQAKKQRGVGSIKHNSLRPPAAAACPPPELVPAGDPAVRAGATITNRDAPRRGQPISACHQLLHSRRQREGITVLLTLDDSLVCGNRFHPVERGIGVEIVQIERVDPCRHPFLRVT